MFTFFSSIYLLNSCFKKMKLHVLVLFYLLNMFSLNYGVKTYEDIRVCSSIFTPKRKDHQHSCSLICSIDYTKKEGPFSNFTEIGICKKGGLKPFMCQSDHECERYDAEAGCRPVPCACDKDVKISEYGIIFPNHTTIYTTTCVVPPRWVLENSITINLDFPMKMLMIMAFTIMSSCLLYCAIRLVLPCCRIKTRSRLELMHSPRIYRRFSEFQYQRPNHSTSESLDSVEGANTKPPSYELVVDGLDPPPSYQEVTGLILPEVTITQSGAIVESSVSLNVDPVYPLPKTS